MESYSCSAEDCIDLHCHSTASDGTLSPAVLVARAAHLGLRAVALTDHDTMGGLSEAAGAAADRGIEFIPGVELSLNYDLSPGGQMHLVGLFIDFEDERLQRGLEYLRRKRRERTPKILKKLADAGMDIPEEMVAAIAGDSVVGRPHIARAMVEAGMVASLQEAFDLYIKKGAPAYVIKEKFDMGDAISMVLDAGGIPVLAHPKYLKLDDVEESNLLDRMMEMGLKGMEVYYSDHTPAERKKYLGLAQEKGLLVSGGSDFHGSNKPDIELGCGKGDLCVPYSLLGPMKEHLKGT